VRIDALKQEVVRFLYYRLAPMRQTNLYEDTLLPNKVHKAGFKASGQLVFDPDNLDVVILIKHVEGLG
jgi:hypothetical protein